MQGCGTLMKNPSTTPLQKIRFALIRVLMILALAVGVIWVLFYFSFEAVLHAAQDSLLSHPNPAADYAQAMAQFQQIQQTEGPELNPVCRSVLLTHGHRTERALVFLVLWLSARIGSSFLRRRRNLEEEVREDFGVILAATLTLLGLIIGFSFSMAISRYDQRKNYEEAEANAIGTEYIRADLLPVADAARVRALLRNYLDQRILFYKTRDEQQLRKISAATGELQSELWSIAKNQAAAQPTAVFALVVSGMNDVLNSQGYTQAAWWSRIPLPAWGLMVTIAICGNLLIGYGARKAETEGNLMLVLPLLVSISFFLIADIDSPRGGLIRVQPQNLLSFAQSLKAH
jgi:hypothetical protein